MKVPKEINTYCPKCDKESTHTVKFYTQKPRGGLSVGTRRSERKRKGYFGKVKGQATVKKVSKRQKAILKCKVCSYSVERVFGNRTKKKLEYKM
ncbi:50S ribosomal protein L44e [Candidatus Mancarchaeum acidiphilum]|uniref:50S ribosomal protein L44e n=1 Tax=Candidatus Mancarchaeum acidiphilum TaxID=1920749 RepID=A0A218NP57_9ARCH|nr:50S ribosomal protein L44e [Candidatus Mancarchaeum acidiphilum]ASI14245.1 50S ribosomal protein L44e [Candidatus Mancarchaeum acidiphilum]